MNAVEYNRELSDKLFELQMIKYEIENSENRHSKTLNNAIRRTMAALSKDAVAWVKTQVDEALSEE